MKTRNYLEEALKISDLNYGEEHESVAATLQWIGNVYREWNDLDEAMAYYSTEGSASAASRVLFSISPIFARTTAKAP